MGCSWRGIITQLRRGAAELARASGRLCGARGVSQRALREALCTGASGTRRRTWMAWPLRLRCLVGLTSPPGVRLGCSRAPACVGGDCGVGWYSMTSGAEARHHALSRGAELYMESSRARSRCETRRAALNVERRTKRRQRRKRRGACRVPTLRALTLLGMQAPAEMRLGRPAGGVGVTPRGRAHDINPNPKWLR